MRRSRKVRIAEISIAEVGAVELATIELNIPQDGSVEVGTAEIGAAELGTAEIETSEVDPCQILFREIGAAEISIDEILQSRFTAKTSPEVGTERCGCQRKPQRCPHQCRPSGANLSGAILSDSDLSDSIFTNLARAKLRKYAVQFEEAQVCTSEVHANPTNFEDWMLQESKPEHFPVCWLVQADGVFEKLPATLDCTLTLGEMQMGDAPVRRKKRTCEKIVGVTIQPIADDATASFLPRAAKSELGASTTSSPSW